jgi:hypothetical protein
MHKQPPVGKTQKLKKKTKKSTKLTSSTRRRNIITSIGSKSVLGPNIVPVGSNNCHVSIGLTKSRTFAGLLLLPSPTTLTRSISTLLLNHKRGMKYVPYNDGVEVIRSKPSQSTATNSSTTPPTPSSTPPRGKVEDCYDFSSYPTPARSTTPHNNSSFGSSFQGSQSRPKHTPTQPQIDTNPLYAPLAFHTTNSVLRNSPLLRQLDVNKIFFQTVNFLFLGPKDAQIESLAYLFGQQNGNPVKYINHKNCSSILEDIVVNMKEYILWSDVPDLIQNSEFSTILPSQNFITIYLDYPASKARFASTQTRENLINMELVAPGHLDSTHPVLSNYKVQRPDSNAPITSDDALMHSTLWQFDGAADYRILLTENTSPNEIFDRVQARMATSDAYITTRNEFTSESNAATQDRIQSRNEQAESGGFSNYDSITGETEIVTNADGTRSHQIKKVKKKVKKVLPNGAEIEVDDEDDHDHGYDDDNQEGNGEEGLFELNSFLNAVVSPIAKRGGLFIPDMPSPYLLNQHHMFDVDGGGEVVRYPEDLAQIVVEKTQDQIAQEGEYGQDGFDGFDGNQKLGNKKLTKTKNNQNSQHDDVHRIDIDPKTGKPIPAQNPPHRNQPSSSFQHNQEHEDPYADLGSEDLEPEWTGSVNQMHLFPQSLRRMVELNYLQRLQRIIEGFPLAGIRPLHVSNGLMQYFFSFTNEAVLTTSSLHHIKNTKHAKKIQLGVTFQDENGNKTTELITRDVNINDIPLTQSGQPVELPPFNKRPTYFVELYHSEQGIYNDVRTKITQALLHSAEAFETGMKDANIKQQKTMHLLQHGYQIPESKLHKPPSMYDRFALLSTGTPDFTLSALQSDTTLVPHVVMLPIRSKGLLIPKSDETNSSTHINRGLFSTAWSPLQYLQLYSALQVKDPRVVPIGATYHESRSLQQLTHNRLKKPFVVNLEQELPNNETLFPGEDKFTRLIKFGTMNATSFPSMVADVSIFTHGYLELVKQGLIQLPPDRTSQQIQEQIKAGMGFDSLYGLNKDEEGNLLHINKYTQKITPHIYSRFSPQHLSQWDHPLFTTIKPQNAGKITRGSNGAFIAQDALSQPAQLVAHELNKDNIHTFFKPCVVDVVIPLTDISLLPAAIMSRDMGTPVRQFVLALDDKHKFLHELLVHGRIPAISKRRKNDIWHLKREDISALERFFYLICGRDGDLIPEIIHMLELHYTASLYVHDPNRNARQMENKRALDKEAKVALGPDAGRQSVKRGNAVNKSTPLGRDGNVIDINQDGVKEDQQGGNDNGNNQPVFKKKQRNQQSSTPSQGVVIDVGDQLPNDDVAGKGVYSTTDGDVQSGSEKPLMSHQIRPVKRRRGDDDDDESEPESSEELSSEDYVNEVSQDADDGDDDDDDESEEQNSNEPRLDDQDIVQYMMQDPDVEPQVKRIIAKMLKHDEDIKNEEPTNAEIDLFQKAFFRKEAEYNEIWREVHDETDQNNQKLADESKTGSIKQTIIQKDENGQDVELEVEFDPNDFKNAARSAENNPTKAQLSPEEAELQRRKLLQQQIAPEGVGDYQESEIDVENGQNVNNYHHNDQYDDEIFPNDQDSPEWEDHMIMETDEYHLPQHIKQILQNEFSVTVVPKKFVWDTVKRSLKENGRLLDMSTALSLAASTINPTIFENSALDLDEYYDAVLDHASELTGEPKKHRRGRKVEVSEGRVDGAGEDANGDNDKKLSDMIAPEDLDINELIKQFDGTSPVPDIEKIKQKVLENNLANQKNKVANQVTQNKNVTNYPKMEIPLVIPSLNHPFQDYEELCEIFGLPHDKPSLKLDNKELAIHVLKQMQSLYANAMTIAREEGFELDNSNPSNVMNRTKDVILPPPHYGTLSMLGNVQKFSEKPVRMPFVAPLGPEASKFTNFDFVLNDQLMRFLKLKATGGDSIEEQKKD